MEYFQSRLKKVKEFFDKEFQILKNSQEKLID